MEISALGEYIHCISDLAVHHGVEYHCLNAEYGSDRWLSTSHAVVFNTLYMKCYSGVSNVYSIQLDYIFS